MPAWDSDVLDLNRDGEPNSLIRLRESLASLERLDRRRGHGHEVSSLSGVIEEPSRLRPSPTIARSLSPKASPRNVDGELFGLGLGPRIGSYGRSSPSRAPSPVVISPRPAPSLRPTTSAIVPRSTGLDVHRSHPSGVNDSALARALQKCQDRCVTLQRERDDALHKLAQQEAECCRLTMLLERTEAENSALSEERQRHTEEVACVRRELREAVDSVSQYKAEAHSARMEMEETRGRFDRMMVEQRNQIESLEDASNRASRDLAEHTGRASEFVDSLFSVLLERVSMQQFVIDLLSTIQSLFYDPTPFVTTPPDFVPPKRSRASNQVRPRSAGAQLRGGLGGGGGSLYRSYDALELAKHTQSRAEWREGIGDLRELITSLEREVSEASHEYSLMVQRIVGELERSTRVVGVFGVRPTDRDALEVCNNWVESERKRRSRTGDDDWNSRIDWLEERSQYHAATRVMEVKFAQLAKLKRVLVARQSAISKAPKRARPQLTL